MPRAGHICGTLDCTRIVAHGTRYCDDHAQPRYQQQRTERTESARRTGTRRFNQHIRPAVLRRDGYICQLNIEGVCVSRGEPLPADQLEADHIIECAHGGSDDLDNLRAVCRPCHRRRTATDAGKSAAEQFLAPAPPRPRRKPAPAQRPVQIPRTIYLRP
jgi:5-methylcytosine-specific restriction protein A